ncbi:MAG: ATP-grasp domain-containing protein [Bryobacteraceae bacterium]
MRLMLFAATTGYQIRVFAEAARRLGVDFRLATDRCRRIEDPWGDHALPVRFGDTAGSLKLLRLHRFDAVVAVGDAPTVLAAEAAEQKGILFHPPAAVRACRNKFLARQAYQAAGLPVPSFFTARLADGPAAAAARAPYPCVLKPLGLSGSRGVIRANTPDEFAAAFHRIRGILADPEIRRQRQEHDTFVQVESYIPGREFAVEGLVTGGDLRVLALFDKPDPLEGPYFEETIYVTPSRADASLQEAIVDTVRRAAGALGLRHGPLHAECRVDERAVWMLEIAARPIGGLCAKTLRFTGGMPLEELIIRHAIGEDVRGAQLEGPASGVMMIPIPKSGVFQSVRGVERAAAVPCIEEALITATPGQVLKQLPEGSSYLGFLFARAAAPEAVEEALRAAHAELAFEISTALA